MSMKYILLLQLVEDVLPEEETESERQPHLKVSGPGKRRSRSLPTPGVPVSEATIRQWGPKSSPVPEETISDGGIKSTSVPERSISDGSSKSTSVPEETISDGGSKSTSVPEKSISDDSTESAGILEPSAAPPKKGQIKRESYV